MSPDTSSEAYIKQREIVFSKSVSERFLMGLEMSDFGWQLMVDNVKQKSGNETYLIELITRLYRNDFSEGEFEKVLAYFRNNQNLP